MSAHRISDQIKRPFSPLVASFDNAARKGLGAGESTMNILRKAILGAVLGATTLTTAIPAMADDRRGNHRDRGGDEAAIAIGAGLIGLAVGAAIASDHDDDYYDRGYYYPRYRTYYAYRDYPRYRGGDRHYYRRDDWRRHERREHWRYGRGW